MLTVGFYVIIRLEFRPLGLIRIGWAVAMVAELCESVQ